MSAMPPDYIQIDGKTGKMERVRYLGGGPYAYIVEHEPLQPNAIVASRKWLEKLRKALNLG